MPAEPQRLSKAWQGLRAAFGGGARGEATRWVVLDVETTGLDSKRASLLAVAAVGIQVDWASGSCCLVPGDSFERFVKPQQQQSDEENVLIHGIGLGEQALAEDLRAVMPAFREYVAVSPLLAFHASFDRQMLDRACKVVAIPKLPGPWLDLAELCRVLWPGPNLHALDDWLEHFGVSCPQRHLAASDAWAEAELLQLAWPLLVRQCSGFDEVLKLSRQARWLAA